MCSGPTHMRVLIVLACLPNTGIPHGLQPTCESIKLLQSINRLWGVGAMRDGGIGKLTYQARYTPGGGEMECVSGFLIVAGALFD